ncbi:unnamed protein product (macronuclear) [Paramecium tetraurelia]|uniref:Alpha-type protein kinase domain-containing protein n=1 Tax=Paramecium tetraurelia TaxID=5888 RepID=A0DA99_PARTE|nr:uncharacterized protein GSPATT00014873001 [Paramecium tetraurelia]CAK79966.1 unnamed protein product [Paramecium tetraurelia]|eukprot:XP_001447363.1 hypothetical protein (macronuclear) [Paramecium tetraurelia strain d4-2]
MNQNQDIGFLLPDGNIQNIKIQNNNLVFYRNISKCKFLYFILELRLPCPDEFIAVLDLKTKKLISKFIDKLEQNCTYKLFNIQEAIAIIQQKDQEINQSKEENKNLQEQYKKAKEEINDIKAKLDQDAKNSETNKTQSDKIINELNQKINEFNQKIKEIDPKLSEAQNKIKEQLQDLERARYDLKQANSKLEVWKQDMEKQLVAKDTKIQELTNQGMQQDAYIQNLITQLKQERMKVTSIQEACNNQMLAQMQQWQQYFVQLDSEKKLREQENYDITKKKQDLEVEVKKLKKKLDDEEQTKKLEIDSLQNEKQSLDSQITRLRNQVRETEAKLAQQKRQLEDGKSQEINIIKEQLDKANQKCKSLELKYKYQNDEMEREIQQKQNTGQVKEEEIQLLLRQIQELKDQNERLSEEIDVLQAKNTNITQNLNNSQNLYRDLEFKATNLEDKLKSVQEESKRELTQKNEKIEEQKLEYQNILNKKDQELQGFIKKQEEVEEELKNKIKNLQKENEKVQQDLAKIMKEKREVEEEAVKERQNLQKVIGEADIMMLQKDQELVAIQNSAAVPAYQFRIQRLVEQVPREYSKDIEFAIETMMFDKVNPEAFLKTNQAQCQELEFKLSHVQILQQKAEKTLYNISDQDYRQCVKIVPIGDMTGIQCFAPVKSSDQSLDRYFFFKCQKCPDNKKLEGKIFGIKQFKKQDLEDLETLETATDNCMSTVIAQEFMRQFVQELTEKKVKIEFDFKFRDQYIIEAKKSFKQYLQEQIKGQQLVLQNEGIKNFVEFVEALDGEQSNDFYDYTREYQLDKKQPKDGNIIKAYLEIIKDKKLEDIYKKFNPETIRKQLSHFVDFIGGNMKEMPQKLCYAIQEIEVKPDFLKYNGGHLKFDSSPEGKFLSAFTYYSIVKSQRQLCISHMQGVKNQIYDPMVSTYDGFLDKMDQGYNEIRTIESKFLSEPNINKGVEFLKALGIKWN